MSIEKYLSIQRSILFLIKDNVALTTLHIANLIYETHQTTSRHLCELHRKKILNKWSENRDETWWSFMTKLQYEAYLKTLASKGKDIHLVEDGSSIEA